MLRPYLTVLIHALLPDGQCFEHAPNGQVRDFVRARMAVFPHQEWCSRPYGSITCKTPEYDICLYRRGFVIGTYVAPATIWPRVLEFIALTGVRAGAIFEVRNEWHADRAFILDFYNGPIVSIASTRERAVHALRIRRNTSTL